jgi:hypothetical protein
MVGSGVDLSLKSCNEFGHIKWCIKLVGSSFISKLIKFDGARQSNQAYTDPGNNVPLNGNELFGVYSLKWKGLDSKNGDPIGYLNKNPSKDYAAILASKDPAGLVYHGSALPVLFANIRNELTWKNFSFSFTVTGKFNYYFRRPSIQYNDLYTGGAGHPDFNKRWMKPGDEMKTNVPSIPYPANVPRDVFYTSSDALIDRGDHVRVQDAQLSVDLSNRLKSFPRHFRFYIYGNNLAILWRANDDGIDPDYLYRLPPAASVALGLTAEL